MAREQLQKKSLGVLHQKIKESRVLLVGAGGIGCELLKNLVLTGYGEVHIIDLDTIDLSNLNRQFLFRHEHIKKSKAIVAKDVAQKFNPRVKLVAHFANIKDTQFNVEWFSSFDIVFNALDNLEARRHVNRMCLAADVPLIESGTTGFNGQVQVIKKRKTACYDCNPKQTPKSFPVCTIRSTPSQPIHCIVWAKSYLLPELFGVSEDEPEVDTAEDADNAEEIQKLKEEAEALKKIKESLGSDDFAQKVFDKVFKEDIERLQKMEDMWKTRKAPTALSYEGIIKDTETIPQDIHTIDQNAWTIPETLVVFRSALNRLSQRHSAGEQTISFDKDDADTLDLVTAAANLRSHIFHIPLKSKFDTKQMAGNIIPAIATTNAMIAGLCVMQAFKVMKGDYPRTKMIFLDRGNMSAGSADIPNPNCAVCSVTMARIKIDEENATLGDLVDGLLKNELGYGDEISVLNESGGIVFDPDMEDNLEKKLSELQIKEGGFVIVKDDEDEPRVDLHLIVEAIKGQSNGQATEPETEPAASGNNDTEATTETNGETDKTKDQSSESKPDKRVSLVPQSNGEKLEIPRKPKAKPETNGVTNNQEIDKVTETGTMTMPTLTKRKREIDDTEDDNDAPLKKVQQNAPTKSSTTMINGMETIVLDEDEGAIEID